MSRDDAGYRELEKELRYRFRDANRLQQALTHRSWNAAASGSDYERLEFLGDRVLALIITELLLGRFPQASEGKLGAKLSVLVSGRVLADIGRSLSLSQFILAAEGGREPSPAQRDSVIADCCEAVIGGLYLDGGLDAARTFVRRFWGPLIDTDMSRPAKTELQEWAQGQGLPLPRYRTVTKTGPAHEPEFTVELVVSGCPTVEATGPTIRSAEQRAAERMLGVLGLPH